MKRMICRGILLGRDVYRDIRGTHHDIERMKNILLYAAPSPLLSCVLLQGWRQRRNCKKRCRFLGAAETTKQGWRFLFVRLRFANLDPMTDPAGKTTLIHASNAVMHRSSDRGHAVHIVMC